MANGKIPNINNKFYGEKLVEVTFPDSTSSLGFNEYNAVLNNVNSSVSSSLIMDADYALNARIPTNNNRLLSGTAQRMEIQDSNYSSVAWTSPRYVGSQTISATYNDYQSSGSSVTFADGTIGTWKGDQVFDEYPDDENFTRGNPLGKVPAIDLYSTHFVLFDRININSGFEDGDVFHCLYLIDDQGNKVPLTYKNKNLVDLQRLYVNGSNAEVLFLGQNNQEVLDEYPILSVGEIESDRAVFTNDLFEIDTSNDAYVPDFNSREIAASNAVLTNPTQRQWDFSIRFVPSALSVESINNNNYKLKYSEPSIRIPMIDAGVKLPYTKVYNRFNSTSGYSNQPSDNFMIDGTDATDTQTSIYAATYLSSSHDSRFDPFYFLTYNPQTEKIFEGTLLEQKVNWEIKTFDPVPIQGQSSLFASIQNNTPTGIGNINNFLNGDFTLLGISQYTENWSPLKIGDIINIGQIPISTPAPAATIGKTAQIGTIGLGGSEISAEEVSDNLRTFYAPTDSTQLKVTDINININALYEVFLGSSGDVNYRETIFTENGLSAISVNTSFTTPSIGVWLMQELVSDKRGIRNDRSPSDQTGLPLSEQPSKGNFSLAADNDFTANIANGEVVSSPHSIHTIYLHNDIGTVPSVDKSDILRLIRHGDVIELAFLPNFGGNTTIESRLRYKIISTPTISNNIFNIKIQFLEGPSSQLTVPDIRSTPIGYNGWTGKWIISRLYKMYDPSINVTSNNISLNYNPSSSIQTSGSALTVIQKEIHEQYITSQFLEGTGVGVLIPDQYDPKLREQLPNIINKTGIDINSLT